MTSKERRCASSIGHAPNAIVMHGQCTSQGWPPDRRSDSPKALVLLFASTHPLGWNWSALFVSVDPPAIVGLAGSNFCRSRHFWPGGLSLFFWPSVPRRTNDRRAALLERAGRVVLFRRYQNPDITCTW